jgi:predicted dinucleotide-binding enzyme
MRREKRCNYFLFALQGMVKPDQAAVSSDATHKVRVIRLSDEPGCDGVNASPLDGSWRQQPGTPFYAANPCADRVRKPLVGARLDRKPEIADTFGD